MKIKILSLLCLLLSLGSCNKWLDVDLIDRVDENKLFSTSQGFHEALAGVYSLMSKRNMYGGTLTMEYMDIYAQYYSFPTTTSSLAFHQQYDYENVGVKSLHSQIWNNMYNCISGANNILRWIEKNPNVLNEVDKKQIKGEALAIRAFLHFDMIRMFCPDVKLYPKEKGIPYNKIFGVSLPHQYSVEECVQLVLDDLNAAQEQLANDPITTVAPYSIISPAKTKDQADLYVARMNLYTVLAMKARLYNMRGDDRNAIKYAEEVINSNKFRLHRFEDSDKTDAEIDMLFSDEHIFSLRNKDIMEYTKPFYYTIEKEGSATLATHQISDISTIYESNTEDVRYNKWFDMNDGLRFRKYPIENNKMFFKKVPIIKLSEMYLILSEAYFKTDTQKSLYYINKLRDHRIRNNAQWTYITKEYIFQEMQREFIGEGLLWYAYKRFNMPIPSGTIEGDIMPSNLIYVFPMPDNEIENGNRY